MPDYLNKNAKFRCSASQAVEFTCLETANTNVTYKNQLVLTDSLKLIGRGTCIPLQTAAQGTPVPCCCTLGSWLKVDSNKKIGSHSLLTSASTNFCKSAPAPVSIFVEDSGTSGKFSTGFKPPTASLILAQSQSSNQQESNSTKTSTAENPNQKKVDSIPEKSSDDTDKPAKNSEMPAKELKTNSTSNLTSGTAEQLSKKSSFRCQNCKKECPYRMTGDVKDHYKNPVINDSDQLEKNYFKYLEKIAGINVSKTKLERQEDLSFYTDMLSSVSSKGTEADIAYLKSLIKRCELKNDRGKYFWSYASHHIMPGNEVFKKFPKCHYVANLCVDPSNEETRVFNINDSVNCIKLLLDNRSSKDDTFFDKLHKQFNKFYKNNLPDVIKSIFPTPDDIEMFDIMCAVEDELDVKMQWHDTHHSYNMNAESHMYKFKKNDFQLLKEMINQKFPGKDLVDYETALMNRMSDIEDDIDMNDICAKIVHDKIVKLIEDVRRHLSDFAKNPCASYPYFVTKNNYYYALLKG